MTRAFVDRHRCQLGFVIIEQPGQLRVEPKVHSMRGIVAWILFVHLVIIGIVVRLAIWKRHPNFFLPFFAAMALEFPTLLGTLFAMSRAELAKGPLLEVNEYEHVVALLRDDRKLKFDNIEAVFLLAGWYEWTDWAEVAEMTLIAQGGDDRIELFPVILHNDVKAVEDLAERVAALIGKPVEHSKLLWEDRQRHV